MKNESESFAKYHDEHARYGGISAEFHMRAACHIRNAQEIIDRLRNEIYFLKNKEAK